MTKRTKICVGCQRLFEGRRDAKTCSPRCRKRFQRARDHFYTINTAEAVSPVSTVFNQEGRGYYDARR
jgi:hypothetical protein